MKNNILLLFILAALLPVSLSAQKYLQGKVRIVNSFPDYKVKIVNSHPDLKIQKVTSTPSKCGQWQFVNSFEDFTVQFVDAFEDFTIQYVDAFPGLTSGTSRVKTESEPSSQTARTGTDGGGYVESGKIISFGNSVPPMSVKQINGHYFFSVPRLPGKWFPAKARVQMVDTLADLRVDEIYNPGFVNLLLIKVDSVPQKDLHWQFVDSLPDFTIQMKNGIPDKDIRVMFYPHFCPQPEHLHLTTPKKYYWVEQ